MAYTLANLQDDVRNYTEVDDSVLSNFFFFTVNSDTATTGNIKGGGYGCSVGPITISA